MFVRRLIPVAADAIGQAAVAEPVLPPTVGGMAVRALQGKVVGPAVAVGTTAIAAVVE
jgi:hypothetical protein